MCRDGTLAGLARVERVVNRVFLHVRTSPSVRCSEYLYLMREKRSIVGLDDGMEFANLKASMSRVKIDTTDQVRAMGRVLLSNPSCVLFSRRGWGRVLLLNHSRPLKLVGNNHAACIGSIASFQRSFERLSWTLERGAGWQREPLHRKLRVFSQPSSVAPRDPQ